MFGGSQVEATDIKRLHRFAQILQNHVINRHGILKNELRGDLPYRLVKGIADVASHVAAATLMTVGRRYFRRTVKQLPAKPRLRLEPSRPVATGTN